MVRRTSGMPLGSIAFDCYPLTCKLPRDRDTRSYGFPPFPASPPSFFLNTHLCSSEALPCPLTASNLNSAVTMWRSRQIVYADGQYPRYPRHPAHSSTEINSSAFIPPRAPFLSGDPKSIPDHPLTLHPPLVRLRRAFPARGVRNSAIASTVLYRPAGGQKSTRCPRHA